MPARFSESLPVFLLAFVADSALAAPAWESVEPVLAAKCYECHGGEKTKGGVDLKALSTDPKVGEEFDLWERVLDSVLSGEMPPPKSEPLAEGEGERLAAWVEGALDELAAANSGDPGPVTMRRLTNAEYDRTLRDLAGGRDYGLAKEFQTDGGGGEGFANTGDTLFLSPAALDKYFTAARQFADHATVMPGTGIVFHEHRVGLRGFEQVKAQAEQGLYVWYQQKAAPHLPGDFDDLREDDYLLACWKHRHFGTPLAELAKSADLKPPFLDNWWRLVNATEPPSRYLDLVRVAWRELPAADEAKPGEVPPAVAEGIARIGADLRSWNNPQKPGSGVQRRQQDSDGIRPYPMSAEVRGHREVHLCFGDVADGNAGDIALVTKIEVKLEEGGADYFQWLERRLGELRAKVAADPNPAAPADLEQARARLAELEAARALFGRHPLEGRSVEPQVLAVAAPRIVTLPLPEKAVSVRADTRLDFDNPAVDEATIQWTLTTGAPPDPTKVFPGVLTIWKIQTQAKNRAMGEFSVMKTAFPDMFERRLEEVARNLYRGQPGFTVYYFSDEQLGEVLGEKDRAALTAMRKDWRLVSPREPNEAQRRELDGAMVWHLHHFASRAWRRPLAEGEREALAALYHERVGQGLDRESAVREGIVRVLVSPHFLFKAETLPTPETLTDAPSEADLPLGPWELASRLSYFLWSSLPDWQLRKAAEDGSLADPAVLAAETRRLLKDPRATALAEEFAGQWLKFAGFRDHDGVDAAKFPEMTPELRADMEREAIEFFARLFREDRRVMDIVAGRTSFLNERLAAFYGVPGVDGPEFREVDLAAHHRGGLLGMGAVLTKTSRPTRTSPVLRGEFLHAVVLGHSSPPPPPNVPELKDDGGLAPASLREALMKHREDQACAVCHDRIDPLGFALESFDAIGRFRASDEAGGAIDDTGELRDGTVFDGFAGLRDYLAKNDEPFVGHFSRKLLGYALGRQVLPSDRELLERMGAAVRANDGRVSAAVLEIVTSRQFLNRRREAAVLASHP
jgi:hypothetical protein